jgi:hypothetical protein
VTRSVVSNALIRTAAWARENTHCVDTQPAIAQLLVRHEHERWIFAAVLANASVTNRALSWTCSCSYV